MPPTPMERPNIVTSLLSIQNLTVGYDKDRVFIPLIKELNLEIAPGETLGIVGESGSGKSMTARAIMGLLAAGLRIDQGDIVYHDGAGNAHSIAGLKRNGKAIRALRGKEMAMVFQEPMASLSPVHTIGAQIATTLLQHTDLNKKQAANRAIELLDDVGMAKPAEVARQYPHRLSGGMRQRAMIAMALSCAPKLLICDEPTTALDVTTEAQIVDLLQDLQTRHRTAIMFISHNIALVSEMSQQLIVMDKGQAVETASTKALLAQPKHPYTQRLLASMPALAKPGEILSVSSKTQSGDKSLQKGYEIIANKDQYRAENLETNRKRFKDVAPIIIKPQITTQDDVLLKIEGLTKSFPIKSGILQRHAGSVDAVKDVELALLKGETLALVGESGSGKSTTAKLIMGAYPVTSGSIMMNQNDGTMRNITDLKGADRKALWRDMQLIFQDPYMSLNPRMTVRELINEPLHNFGLEKGRKAQARIAELLTLVGLEPSMMDRYPHAFSGGQRQRLGIARALAVRPKIIIGDEPVSALDVSVAAQVLDLFNDLKQKLGLTYLLITHDLSVVRHSADRVAVMYQGRIVEQNETEALFDSPQHPYTKLLLSSIPKVVQKPIERDQDNEYVANDHKSLATN